MSAVLETIKDLETRLSALRKLVEGGAKTKKPKKERDPDAPKREPNDWIKFTQRVDGLLKGADKSFKRVADSKKFAAHLKKGKTYAEWTDEAILAERETWAPPAAEDAASVGTAEVGSAEIPTEAKPAGGAAAEAKAAEPESDAESDGKKRGRKPMTAEQKAAAKAEREAKAAAMTPEEKEALAAKKAEAAAKRKAKKEAAA